MKSRSKDSNLRKQYNRQGNKCVYCNQKYDFDDITRDHFLPKSKGYSFHKNKVFACTTCNSEKNNYTIQELYNKDFIEIQKILKSVIDNNWIITEKQLNRMKYLSKRFKAIGKIINHGGKPKNIF